MGETNKDLFLTYNGDFIETIRIKPSKHLEHTVYVSSKISKNPILRFFKIQSKEGFYTEWGHFMGTKSDLEEGKWNDTKYIVKDNMIWTRPKVQVTFVSSQTVNFKFDTVEECKIFAEKLRDKYVKNSIPVIDFC